MDRATAKTQEQQEIANKQLALLATLNKLPTHSIYTGEQAEKKHTSIFLTKREGKDVIVFCTDRSTPTTHSLVSLDDLLGDLKKNGVITDFQPLYRIQRGEGLQAQIIEYLGDLENPMHEGTKHKVGDVTYTNLGQKGISAEIEVTPSVVSVYERIEKTFKYRLSEIARDAGVNIGRSVS